MNKKYVLFFIIATLSLCSCANKANLTKIKTNHSYTTDNISSVLDNATIQQIINNNPYYPIYTGKALVEFYDGEKLHKVSSLVRKNINNFEVKFLGLFNTVVGTLSWRNGEVNFDSNSKGNIDIEEILKYYDVSKIISFLDSKITTQNYTDFSYIDTDQGKVLINDNFTIVINRDTLMVESYNDRSYLVIYDKTINGKIKKIYVNKLKSDIYITIEFLNIANWLND